jgi:hypothetical protein
LERAAEIELARQLLEGKPEAFDQICRPLPVEDF